MMNKIFGLLAIGLFMMLQGMAASSAEYLISDALLWDYVGVEISATGESHAGFCLDLSISNKRSEPITVVLPAGSIFTPARSGFQRMVVGRAESIYLGSFQTEKVRVYAFCVDFESTAPSKGLFFSGTTTSASTDLKKVLKAIGDVRAEIERKNKSKTKKELEQALAVFDGLAQIAIWAISSDLNRERYTQWLVTEKKIPRTEAELKAEKIQSIVNLILAEAEVKQRF